MTKNQHYIPRFYQQYWECEHKGHLWLWDKNYSKQEIRHHSIKKNCSGEYIYEGDIQNPDNAIEYWYGKFETRCALRYTKFIKSRFCLKRVSLEQKNVICHLYAHLSARNRINIYENTQNRAIASRFTLGVMDEDVDRRYMLNLVALTESGTIKESTSTFAKELMTYKMQILISDKPNIVFCDNVIRQIHSMEEYFFPLCPTMLAHFIKSDEVADGEVRKITETEYSRFIDSYIASDYVKRLYASNKYTLEEIRNKYI